MFKYGYPDLFHDCHNLSTNEYSMRFEFKTCHFLSDPGRAKDSSFYGDPFSMSCECQELGIMMRIKIKYHPEKKKQNHKTGKS